jgi:hypothetical protein
MPRFFEIVEAGVPLVAAVEPEEPPATLARSVTQGKEVDEVFRKICEPRKSGTAVLESGQRPIPSVVELSLGVGTRLYPNLISNRGV